MVTSGPFRRPAVYTVDLVEKKVGVRPAVPFERNLTYTVTVWGNIRSLQGCEMDRVEQRTFRTGDGPGPEPPAPTRVPFSRVTAIFAESCADGACHRARASAKTRQPNRS